MTTHDGNKHASALDAQRDPQENHDSKNSVQGPLILGLDVGGTKCAAIVGDEAGRIHDRIEWPSDVSRGPDAMINDLCTRGNELIHRFGGADRFTGIGVPVGGPLDALNGVVHAPPNLPGWDAIPLQDIIEKRFGLAARIEHDAAACALAEWMWGTGTYKPRVAYLTCGSGFGLGLVIDGHIYRGARGRSPEIGHVRYRNEGPVAFGKTGSYEAFGAGNSLPKLAGWRFPHRWHSDPPSGSNLAELAERNDEDAVEILRLNAQAVGDACALIGDLLVPDVIILGSLSRYLGASWLTNVKDQFAQEASDDVIEHCEICPSSLGPRLQDCSSLAIGGASKCSPRL